MDRMTLLDQLPHLDRGLGVPSVLEGIHELLDLASEEPVAAGDYAALVRDCARARSRLHALELRLVAAADKARVPQASGAASASDWLATTTNTEPAESHRQTRLASDLCEQMLAGTQKSLADGRGLRRARPGDRGRESQSFPKSLRAEQVSAVETALVAKAKVMNPKRLRQAARRALEAVERDPRRSTPPRTPSYATKKNEPGPRPGAPCTTTATAPSASMQRCPPCPERS